MSKRIERDHRKFKRIVRGEIKKSLKKFITKGKIERYLGKKKISVPIPNIDIPRFAYGDNEGVGSGQGPGRGNEPGDQPGEDSFEVELTIEELAEFLGEELELPNIKPKGKKNIVEEKYIYTGISRTGPESLRQFKRTFKEALKRQIMAGEYDPDDPIIIPIKRDKRYRSWQVKILPETSAVIIYMMDTSGSMWDEQIEAVRRVSYFMNAWLISQYKGLAQRYIIHDAAAKEVSMDQFFKRSASGGTKISTAYRLCKEIMEKDYPPAETNIYVFHFSDGGNWFDDSETALKILDDMVPNVNLFGYGQVKSSWEGDFLEELLNYKTWPDNLITTNMDPDNEETYYSAIKDFLGKGK